MLPRVWVGPKRIDRIVLRRPRLLDRSHAPGRSPAGVAGDVALFAFAAVGAACFRVGGVQAW